MEISSTSIHKTSLCIVFHQFTVYLIFTNTWSKLHVEKRKYAHRLHEHTSKLNLESAPLATGNGFLDKPRKINKADRNHVNWTDRVLVVLLRTEAVFHRIWQLNLLYLHETDWSLWMIELQEAARITLTLIRVLRWKVSVVAFPCRNVTVTVWDQAERRVLRDFLGGTGKITRHEMDFRGSRKTLCPTCQVNQRKSAHEISLASGKFP